MDNEKQALREIQESLEAIKRSLYEIKHKLILGVNTPIDWSKYPASFSLKLCDPLPEVEESQLKSRDWSISIDELEDRG